MMCRFPFLTLTLIALTPILGADGRAVQTRMAQDIAAGNPLVVHVVVALCDNLNQGIVPVPSALGNGQDPHTNLYWGARYGLRTFLTRDAGWTLLEADRSDPDRPIFERLVLHIEITRDGRKVPVLLVADAWDGAFIRQAMTAFLSMAAGESVKTIRVGHDSKPWEIRIGGASHLIAYLGHNGLMDFDLESASPAEGAPARSAIVLACASRTYLQDPLQSSGAHPLLLTTGLMAPEAYSLDAAVRAWTMGRSTEQVVDAAARAYHRYQNCGLRAARRLFWGDSSREADSAVK